MVSVGGCKSLSGSALGWVFGDWLESWLTGAQIDEVMVMDGGNKGLDVLSVASDEDGMNHPSGAGEHDAAQSPGLPRRHPAPPLSLHRLIFLLCDLQSLRSDCWLNRAKSKHSTVCHYCINLCRCILCRILWSLFIHLETERAHSSKRCLLFINFVSKHHLLSDCDACQKKIQSTPSATPRA